MNFERRLINLMSQNEFMHDPNHPDYDKYPKRKECWEAIAKELNKDVAYCRTKWFSLRGNYRKLLYKIKANGGVANYQHRKKWKYFDDFAFINKFECMPPLVGYNPKEWNGSLDDLGSSLPVDLEVRLIDLVRNNKVLYNPDCPGYNDVDERNYAWSKIAEELNVEKNALKLKWHSLRSAYFKILRKVNESGGVQNYSPRWRYFDEMSFITPFLGSNTTKTQKDLTGSKTYSVEPSPIYKDATLDIKTSPSVYDEEDNDASLADDTDTSSKTDKFTSLITSTVNDTDNFEDYEEVDEEMEELSGEEEEIAEDKENDNCRSIFHSYTGKSVKNRRLQNRVPSDDLGPCSKYFLLLGTKIDETGIPNHIRFRLEKRVTDLVYDVLAKYSLERVDV